VQSLAEAYTCPSKGIGSPTRCTIPPERRVRAVRNGRERERERERERGGREKLEEKRKKRCEREEKKREDRKRERERGCSERGRIELLSPCISVSPPTHTGARARMHARAPPPASSHVTIRRTSPSRKQRVGTEDRRTYGTRRSERGTLTFTCYPSKERARGSSGARIGDAPLPLSKVLRPVVKGSRYAAILVDRQVQNSCGAHFGAQDNRTVVSHHRIVRSHALTKGDTHPSRGQPFGG